MANKLCQKCGKMLNEDTQFYTYKNGEKTEMCKKCLTMHIDNFDESTYLWLLEKMDVPYVPEEWNVLRDRAYAKNPNLNGMSVFGKYLSKMKLKQWKDYGWKDTERLQSLNREKRVINTEERKKFEAEMKEQLQNGTINEAEYKTLVSSTTQNNDYINMPIQQPTVMPQDRVYSENSAIVEQETSEIIGLLTDADKRRLAMKWGALYQPFEWIQLEQDYKNMTESFDIQDADTINTLIVICKTNLKMNQALDAGDIEGFQKLSKVSESLRKSAKFTAAQNKEQKNEFVDSVGELVAYCEKNGGAIPKYEIKADLDIVDKVINDLKGYTKSLVTEDKTLAKQIEDYLKKLEIAEQQKQDRELAKRGQEVELTDEDYEEYLDDLQDQKEADEFLDGDDE